MIEIKEEKIAEMMFDIWHESNNLKNPVMVGEYIANKLKEAINYTRCYTQLKNGRGLTFSDWLKKTKYRLHSSRYYINKNNKVISEKTISLMHMNDYDTF